jgi:hypothetical protein
VWGVLRQRWQVCLSDTFGGFCLRLLGTGFFDFVASRSIGKRKTVPKQHGSQQRARCDLPGRCGNLSARKLVKAGHFYVDFLEVSTK